MSRRGAASCISAKPPLLTQAEFQQLPLCIQRKYFSTLERLQIAHQSAQLYCTPPLAVHGRPRSSSICKTLASKSHGSPNSHLRALLKKSDINHQNHIVSNSEAHWFLSLPEKVRRQHFSREEQVLLERQLESVSLLPSRGPSRSDFQQTISARPSLSRRHSLSNPASDTVRSSGDRPRTSVDTMNCFDGKPPGMSARQRSRRASIRRTLSISRPGSTKFVRQSTSSSPSVPPSPGTPIFSSHRHSRSRTATASIVRPSTESSSRAFDAAATYYQDPQARQKLRQYLASPQKFDEAVEFGFPSHSTPASDMDLFRAQRSNSGNDAQAFLKEEVISFIDRYDDDDSDDEESLDGGSDSPVTPADVDEIFRPAKSYGSSIFAGLDSSDVPSLNFKFDPDMGAPSRLSQDLLANREMTLRMTLTRPELRANEEDLYGWSKRVDDPLALEELQMSDDMTGQHGAFAVKPNRRSGMFKKILGKVKTERRH